MKTHGRRPPTWTFIARVRRSEPVKGIVNISLDLIRDEDYVELDEGDEFMTVTLLVDPFKG